MCPHTRGAADSPGGSKRGRALGWLEVPVLRSCQSPIRIWLVNFVHLRLHLPGSVTLTHLTVCGGAARRLLPLPSPHRCPSPHRYLLPTAVLQHQPPFRATVPLRNDGRRWPECKALAHRPRPCHRMQTRHECGPCAAAANRTRTRMHAGRATQVLELVEEDREQLWQAARDGDLDRHHLRLRRLKHETTVRPSQDVPQVPIRVLLAAETTKVNPPPPAVRAPSSSPCHHMHMHT